MKAQELDKLIFTPFHTSKILHYFLSGANVTNKIGIKTELIYLVLPIIYNESFYYKLSNSNKTSRFFAFVANSKDLPVFLSQINTKIASHKKITNEALILLATKTALKIGDTINCDKILDYKNEKNEVLKKIYKASYLLGVMLAKERYLTVFLKLRITEI